MATVASVDRLRQMQTDLDVAKAGYTAMWARGDAERICREHTRIKIMALTLADATAQCKREYKMEEHDQRLHKQAAWCAACATRQ
jgi:hypothetical protein